MQTDMNSIKNDLNRTKRAEHLVFIWVPQFRLKMRDKSKPEKTKTREWISFYNGSHTFLYQKS